MKDMIEDQFDDLDKAYDLLSKFSQDERITSALKLIKQVSDDVERARMQRELASVEMQVSILRRALNIE
jgi:hypothetical protein